MYFPVPFSDHAPYRVVVSRSTSLELRRHPVDNVILLTPKKARKTNHTSQNAKRRQLRVINRPPLPPNVRPRRGGLSEEPTTRAEIHRAGDAPTADYFITVRRSKLHKVLLGADCCRSIKQRLQARMAHLPRQTQHGGRVPTRVRK